MLKALLYREARILIKKPQILLSGVLFYMTIIVIFALSGVLSDASPKILSSISWAAYIVTLIMLQRHVFEQDYHTGMLSLLSGGSYEALWMVLAKLLVYLVAYALPVIVASFFILSVFVPKSSDFAILNFLFLALSLMPYLTSTVMLIGALLLGAKQSALIAMVLFLPLAVPALVVASATFMNGGADIALLLALALNLCMVPLYIYATVKTIMIAVESQ